MSMNVRRSWIPRTLTERHFRRARRDVTALSCVTWVLQRSSHLSTLPSMLNNWNTSGQCVRRSLMMPSIEKQSKWATVSGPWYTGCIGFVSCCSWLSRTAGWRVAHLSSAFSCSRCCTRERSSSFFFSQLLIATWCYRGLWAGSRFLQCRVYNGCATDRVVCSQTVGKLHVLFQIRFLHSKML